MKETAQYRLWETRATTTTENLCTRRVQLQNQTARRQKQKQYTSLSVRDTMKATKGRHIFLASRYDYWGGVLGFKTLWDLRGWVSKDKVTTQKVLS